METWGQGVITRLWPWAASVCWPAYPWRLKTWKTCPALLKYSLQKPRSEIWVGLEHWQKPSERRETGYAWAQDMLGFGNSWENRNGRILRAYTWLEKAGFFISQDMGTVCQEVPLEMKHLLPMKNHLKDTLATPALKRLKARGLWVWGLPQHTVRPCLKNKENK